MRIVFIAPPFHTPWLGDNKWITVPPEGYGGIQWIMKNIIDSLLEDGHKIYLLGAPGSDLPNVEVIPVGHLHDIEEWLEKNVNKYDIVHDHSCRGVEFGRKIKWYSDKKIHSHYLSSLPYEKNNIVAASKAHAKYIGLPNVPVIPHPVNPANYLFSEKKENYLLYLGRVSKWKGSKEAAFFAKKANMKLIMAGPAWEEEYLEEIKKEYSCIVEYIGEIGGQERLQVLSKAFATLVFSQSVDGPSGKIWVEPGSQVVSESAICGTPVISSDNGCLKEIVPLVGRVIQDLHNITNKDARNILSDLPSPKIVYEACNEAWNYRKISDKYFELYKKVLKGETW